MTKHLTLLVIVTLCAIALYEVVGVRRANAAAGDIYNLGTLGGTFSGGNDINDAGQVVGAAPNAVGSLRAFLWDSSRGMTDLGTANGYTVASAINASGSVVGVDDGTAFAWTPNEPNSTMGTMTHLARDDQSTAADINAAGHVVGSSSDVSIVFEGDCTPENPSYPSCGTWHYETRAVLWENGVASDLTNSSAPGAANAINNAGQVAGYITAGHAFRYDGTPGSGVMHDLGTLGGSYSYGNAINNSGQVVGYSYTTGDTAAHAFRYIGTPGAGGVMVDLGTLGGTSSYGSAINDAGQVAGSSWITGDTTQHAFLYTGTPGAGGQMIDLDAWLDAVNPTLGAYWRLASALGINNNGLITGQGIYDDGPSGLSDGSRAFVLDVSSLVHPIPGDFNGNGTVDAADYVVWRKNFSGDQTKYDTWRANFGASLGPGSGAALPSAEPLSAAVPEPASLGLCVSSFWAISIFALRKPWRDRRLCPRHARNIV